MKKVLFSSLLLMAFAISSCKKDPVEPAPAPAPAPQPVTPTYTVPATYDFGTNMNYTSSLQRVGMMKELIAYIRTTHTATADIKISASKMTGMYRNTGSAFADANLNSSGVSIYEKTSNAYFAQGDMEPLFHGAESASQSTVAAAEGTAGKLLGPVPTTSNGVRAAYLVDQNGFEFKELVEKGLMGALLYAEGTTILNNISNYDNATVNSGSGTAMEHAWDEAFGYFGVPVSFPTVTTGVAYWGSYCNSVNGAIGSNVTIMNAWLKGRAAISNKDAAGRDAARDIVVSTWEKVCAARFITYMKQAKTNFSNDGLRSHALSEGVGFIRALRYNAKKKISDADITTLSNYIGNNLYKVQLTDIDNAISKMAAVYSLDSAKL